MVDINSIISEIESSAEREFKPTYLPAGIQENIEILEAKMKKTLTGKDIFEVTFVRDGQKSIWTEWPSLEDGEESKARCARQITECLLTICPKEVVSGMSSQNIVEFATKAVAAIEAFKTTKKLRLKLVYVKDKVTVPRHSYYKWIESMEIPKESSKIQIFPRDVISMPTVIQ